MTYKQIEASRELRLWLGQIIIPAIGVGVMVMSMPEVRQTVADKTNSIKQSVKNKFKKD